MYINDLLRISIRQVFRHRRRYFGVVLAIALGTAGLIAMVTVSRDFKNNLNKDLNWVGGVTILRAFFDNSLTSRPQWFKTATVNAITHLPGVQAVSLVAHRNGTIDIEGKPCYLMVLGVDENFWQVRGFWANAGKLFGKAEIITRQRNCVLGEILAKKIFGEQNPLGKTINIYQEIYQVTGLLGGVNDVSLADAAYLPLTTVQDRFPGTTYPDRLYIRCLTWDDVSNVAATILSVVRKHQSDEKLRLDVMWEGLKRVKRIVWWSEFFIYLAITATFVLGGMGIWNVMMAAVRSRTQEIGLKKAMGAEDRDILNQFLTEALCLSIGSYIIGICLGRIIVEVLSYIIGNRPPEDVFILCLVMGLLFSLCLGVGAGLYPSLKASRMDVVDAIRFE